MPVTGITSALTESQAAYLTVTQINTQLAASGYNYTGTPVFSTSSPTLNGFPQFQSFLPCALFRLNCSEHVVSVFSEADYMLTVTNNTTGCIIITSNVALLSTVEDAKVDGPLTGLVLTDVAGIPLTDYQTAKLIQLASAKMVALLNNNVVICTYIYEDWGNWQTSFFLRNIPGISYDGVFVKYPGTLLFWGILVGGAPSILWTYNKATGELHFRGSQNCIYTGEPGSANNEIKVSYIAGNYAIPDAIQGGLYRLMASVLENAGNVKSLKNGTWQVTFKDEGLFNELREELGIYIIFG